MRLRLASLLLPSTAVLPSPPPPALSLPISPHHPSRTPLHQARWRKHPQCPRYTAARSSAMPCQAGALGLRVMAPSDDVLNEILRALGEVHPFPPLSNAPRPMGNPPLPPSAPPPPPSPLSAPMMKQRTPLLPPRLTWTGSPKSSRLPQLGGGPSLPPAGSPPRRRSSRRTATGCRTGRCLWLTSRERERVCAWWKWREDKNRERDSLKGKEGRGTGKGGRGGYEAEAAGESERERWECCSLRGLADRSCPFPRVPSPPLCAGRGGNSWVSPHGCLMFSACKSINVPGKPP